MVCPPQVIGEKERLGELGKTALLWTSGARLVRKRVTRRRAFDFMQFIQDGSA
jgi:hypothetical protein